MREALLPIINKMGDWEPGAIQEIDKGWEAGEVVTEEPKATQKEDVNPLTGLEDTGEGSQIPPARDRDGQDLPMPELEVGVK